MAGNTLQYVTLVVQGGTPIRIADQMGAPYPTTGRGALVFAEGPILNNPTFTGRVITGQGETIGVGVGTVGGPSLFFGNVLNQDGFYSESLHHVDVTVGGVKVADFGPGRLTVFNDINYSGNLTGGTASFTAIDVDNVTVDAGNFTGIVTSTASPVGFIVNGPAVTVRTMGAATAGLLRWTWGANVTSETGTNAGSDYVLQSYNDAGTVLGTPVTVTRSTGAVTLTGGLTGTGATFSLNVRAGLPGTSGSVILQNGGAPNSGYVSFYKPDNTRVGYIGFGLDRISYVAELAGSLHEFSGPVNLAGALTGTTATFSGLVTALTPTPASDSTTKVATTAFVQAAAAATQGSQVTAYATAFTPALSTPVVIAFNTVNSGNTGTPLNTTTGRYTPPAGKYFIQCTGTLNAPSGGNGTWTLQPRKNGTAIPGQQASGSGSASFSVGLTVGCYVDANGTDIFDFTATALASGITYGNATFTAFKVG